MKHIEYRGYSELHKKYIFGYYAWLAGRHCICYNGMWYEIDVCTLGQYTTLKTKDGLKLYAGMNCVFVSNDLCVSNIYYSGTVNGIISWDEFKAGWYIRYIHMDCAYQAPLFIYCETNNFKILE